jgi:hypothetical protein
LPLVSALFDLGIRMLSLPPRAIALDASLPTLGDESSSAGTSLKILRHASMMPRVCFTIVWMASRSADAFEAMFVERFGYLAKPYTTEQLITAAKNLLSQQWD